MNKAKTSKKDFVFFIIEVITATIITAACVVSAYGLTDKFPIFNIF